MYISTGSQRRLLAQDLTLRSLSWDIFEAMFSFGRDYPRIALFNR